MPALRRTSKITAAAATALLAALTLSACGGDKPSVDTKCSDFVDLKQDDQVTALRDMTKYLGKKIDEDPEEVSDKDLKKSTEEFVGFCKNKEFKDGTLKDIADKSAQEMDK